MPLVGILRRLRRRHSRHQFTVREIPLDLARKNFKINVSKPLELAKGFIAKWVKQQKQAKIILASSMGGLFTPAGWGTEHAGVDR